MNLEDLSLPLLAIVGRPNVGKSALFNCICKQRIAIVDEAEGVTRDRIYSMTDLFGFPFRIVDTGGIDRHNHSPYQESISRQARLAIEEAAVVVMVVDGRVGLTQWDEELARELHKTGKPLVLAVNKIDNPRDEPMQYPFQRLGISKIVTVSTTQGYHIAELLEMAFEDYVPQAPEPQKEQSVRVALVGRPNVGKSSLLNRFLSEERAIVSPIPGTTRDSIDVLCTGPNGTHYTLIDTAGIRRKGGEHEVVDKFAAIRTERAIERADICLLVVDSQEGLTTREKKIANQIEEAGKGCILILNKWDLVKGKRMEHFLQEVEQEAPFLKHCPTLCISAQTGRNVEKIFPLIDEVQRNANQRITTGLLNQFIAKAMHKTHPPMVGGKRLRIYYMTQIAVAPPRFVTFVNAPRLMDDSYKKYLYNQFRLEFGFTGVPIRLYLKGKKRPEEKAITPSHKKEAYTRSEELVEERDAVEQWEELDESVDGVLYDEADEFDAGVEEGVGETETADEWEGD